MVYIAMFVRTVSHAEVHKNDSEDDERWNVVCSWRRSYYHVTSWVVILFEILANIYIYIYIVSLFMGGN